MAIDSVDIGGAAANGRPMMPTMRTVMPIDGTYRRADGKPDTELVQRSTDGLTASQLLDIKRSSPDDADMVAYPKSHPAGRADVKKKGGALLVEADRPVTQSVDVVGDVRTGFVTSAGDDDAMWAAETERFINQEKAAMQHPLQLAQPAAPVAPAAPAIPPAGNTGAAELLTQLMALMGQRGGPMPVAPAPAPQYTQPQPPIATDVKGSPLIEVVFITPVGAMASYYHKVVESGKWVILVTDTSMPATQKFIPMPVTDEEGHAKSLHIKVTGKDRRSIDYDVIPMGIQYTVDNYDFIVLLNDKA